MHEYLPPPQILALATALIFEYMEPSSKGGLRPTTICCRNSANDQCFSVPYLRVNGAVHHG